MSGTPIPYPLINGVRYDWSSCEFLVGLIPVGLAGFKALSYSDELKPTKVRGTNAQPIGRTKGQYEAECSFEMYKQEADAFIASLGQGFMLIGFDIQAHYADTGQPTVTDIIPGLRITKVEKGGQEGTDPLTVKFTCDVMGVIVHNGVVGIPTTLLPLP